MYLGAILAAIVILLLFEPLREKVDHYIHRAFFHERVDLERAVARARRQLTHVLQVDAMMQIVMTALEESRRATGSALYLRDPLGPDFELGQSFGPVAPPRIDAATARPLLERLGANPSVVLEQVMVDVNEKVRTGFRREAEADERVLGAAEMLASFKHAVCLSVRGEDNELLAILMVVDDRVSDAFSPDEVTLLESLAVHIGVVVENSRQYRRMQERDRLAALGQMAAGLAHEVKNPLGAIKGAAQLLSEPQGGEKLDPSTKEFLSIIVEEVDRLNRVVGSVLDYARPSKGNPGAVDVNAVVRRTLQLLASDRAECAFDFELAPELPAVRADAEQLHQVLMNLVQNAIQAMKGAGVITVSTRVRPARSLPYVTTAPPAPDFVEISVRDAGPGIAPQVLKNLFVPFFTTKEKGTGLGLAISQRMVEGVGGRIEVVSHPGAGSTFSVLLPTALDPLLAAVPSATAQERDARAQTGDGALAAVRTAAKPA
jgi:signal transduction histidine kinase